jgi:hypothetical protein
MANISLRKQVEKLSGIALFKLPTMITYHYYVLATLYRKGETRNYECGVTLTEKDGEDYNASLIIRKIKEAINQENPNYYVEKITSIQLLKTSTIQP